MWTRSFAVLSLLVVVAVHPQADTPVPVPATDEAINHSLSRLTYGSRPGDLARVKALGLERWLDLQLSPSRIDDAALDARLAGVEEHRSGESGASGATGATGAPSPASDINRKARQVIAGIEEAKLLRAVYSERQLQEVLVDFWFNHFNVFAGKGVTRNYLTEYEREAIRPYVLGSFRDMLEATAKSPAMLFYLDNWQNVAEQSPGGAQRRPLRDRGLSAGARSAKVEATEPTRAAGPSPKRGAAPTPTRPEGPSPKRGINENYARELLELHTLGVDGGYTQADIVNVARALTGWTMKPREGSGTMFVARLHDDKAKTVLGHTIKAGGGQDDIEQVLDMLTAHPSTARHIATKLAIRFVSDAPPAALVNRAAARFTATRGDLREVVRTIITSPEFFALEAYRAKVKTPLDFITSALRTTGAEVRSALPLARELREMGMPLYFCQPPTGYADAAATWVSAGALVSRMNFAVALSKNEIRGVRIANPAADLATEIGAPAFQRQ